MIAGTAAVLLMFSTAASATQSATRPITLSWDANPEPDVLGYIVHVGTVSGSSDEEHDVGNTTSFVYAPTVSGQCYFFTVSAYTADGIESSQSEEVSAIATVAETAAATQSSGGAQVRLRFESADTVSAITALQDGRLLLIENDRSIRLLTAGSSVAQTALETSDTSTAFTEVAVNSRFPTTRFVFVGVITRTDAEQMEFSVVRYREVQDSLGEGAAVLAPMRFTGAHVPRFTVDDDGRIYVAMPADASRRSDPYASSILRFNADGTVPRENPAASPVVARGFSEPANLGWDGRELLAIGADPQWHHTAARMNPDLSEKDSPLTPEPISFGATTRLVAAAFAAGNTAANHGVQAFIDDSQRLFRRRQDSDAKSPRFEEIALTAGAIPVALATGFNRQLYVIVRSVSARFSVIEVAARD